MSVKCDQCGHQFDVKDAKADAPVACPACDAKITPTSDEDVIRIKWGDTPPKKGPNTNAGLSLKKPEPTKSDTSQKISLKVQPKKEPKQEPKIVVEDGLIRVNCQGCDQHLKVPEELAGQEIDCPSCQKKVRIPGKAKPASADPYIRFDCSGCNEPMAVPAKFAGQTIQCPSCETSVAVAQPEEVQPKSQPTGKKTPIPNTDTPEPAPMKKKTYDGRLFWRLIGQAFALKGKNLAHFGMFVGMFFVVMICLGVIPAALVWIGFPYQFAGWVWIGLALFSSTRLFIYMKRVISHCGAGSLELPSCFYRRDDEDRPRYIVSFLQALGIVFILSIPTLVLMMFFVIGMLGGVAGLFLFIPTLFFAAFLFPLYVMVVSIKDSLESVINFKRLVDMLKICILQYLVIVAISAVAGLLFWGITIVTSIPAAFIPALAYILMIFMMAIPLYIVVVNCRLLGFMYHAQRHKLNWDGDEDRVQ